MEVSSKPVYRFGDVEIDTWRGSLMRSGKEIYLRQQTFQVLLYLLERRERLVTKEELFDSIWKDATVTDNALLQCIFDIRKSLGDDSRHPRFIKTFPKVGYRFVGEVEEVRPYDSPVIEIEEVTAFQLEFEKEGGALTEREVRAPATVTTPRRIFASNRLRFAAVALVPLVILSAYLGQRHLRSERQLAQVSLPQIAGKKRIAVMYFDNRTASRELDWLREGLADMLITDLSRANGLTLLSRQQLHLLLERIGYKAGNSIRLDEAIDIARRSKAEIIVLGSFTSLDGKVRIEAQLHDASNSQLLATEYFVVDTANQILTQIDLFSFRLASHLGAASSEQEKKPALADVMTSSLGAYRYYSLALEKAQAYHSTEAINLWQKAIALDPQFAMAYGRIGYTHALIRVNETEKSKPYLENAFQLSHRLTDRDKLYISAWYAFVHEGRVSAIRAFRDLIGRYPHEVEAYLRLGYLLVNERQFEEAIAAYKQGLLVDPEDQNLYNALGFSYSGLGRYVEAIAAHQRYVELAPDEPNAYDSLGMTYNEAGRYQAALVEFERALKLDPEFHFANLHVADVHLRLGRYQTAIRQYQRFLQLAPSDWDRAVGYNRIALLYWQKGDLAQAQEAARQELKYYKYLGGAFLIALAQGDFETANKLKAQIFHNFQNEQLVASVGAKQFYFCRGYYALKSGRSLEAIEYFKEAVRQQPLVWNVGGVEDCLANAYLELGRLDEAIAEYERLLHLNQNFPLAHYHLAQAYERKGDHERARTAYERFLQIWKDADGDLPEIVKARSFLST